MANSTRNATFDEKRAQELHSAGASCRAIADALGCAPSTVSRWAKKAGLTFDRAQTDMASRAHRVDLASARIELAQLMFVAARDGILELDGPITVYNFGGKDNEFNSHTFDKAPVDVRRQAMTTAGIAFDKINKIVESSDEVDGLAPVESMLGRLVERFRAAPEVTGD